MLFLSLIFLLILSSFDIYSNNERIDFQKISLDHGLSQSTVFCILQDSTGFLWVGTESGLNRYDGYSFNVFKHNPNIMDSISYSYIYSLAEDSSGNIWIGTRNEGLNKYDHKNKKFRRYKTEKGINNSISSNTILTILTDIKGTIWIGTKGGGLNKYIKEQDNFVIFKNNLKDKYSLNSNNVNIIYEDSSSMLWIGTDKGLNYFIPENQTFIRYNYLDNHNNDLLNSSITAIIGDKEEPDYLWIGVNGYNLIKFNKRTGKYIIKKSFKNTDNNHKISSLHMDDSGKIWIGTNSDLYIYNKKTLKISRYTHNRYDKNSLSDKDIHCIYEDITGIIWIGTTIGGISKYDPKKGKFKLYQNIPNNSNSLGSNMIRTIYEDKTRTLWVGTGLTSIDRNSNKFNKYDNDINDQNSISSDDIYSITENKRGQLWIGTGFGLNSLSVDRSKFTRYFHKPDNPHSLSHNHIFTTYVTIDDTLWVGTWKGLNRFNSKDRTFTRFLNDPKNPHSISGNTILNIYEDSKKRIWIGTADNGLNIYNSKNHQFVSYKYNTKDNLSLSNNSISSILEDYQGNIWIGTALGLNKFNYKTKTFIRYGFKENFPSLSIGGILEDNNKYIWISHLKGITKFNPKSKEIINFTPTDGLQSYEFNSRSVFKNKKGEMFFGGINGFNSFFPDKIVENIQAPIVNIISFKIFNKEKILPKPIFNTHKIELSYNQNYLSFKFVAFDFSNPKNNYFAYKMEGLENGWTYSVHRNFANYTDMKPGRYTFKVKGSINNNHWSDKVRKIEIYISPPFWRTWWAYIIYILSVFLLFLSGHNVRVSQLKKRKMELIDEVQKRTVELEKSMQKLSKMNNELKDANRLKNEFLGIAAHDLKNPLQVILGYSDILKKKTENKNIKELKKINISVERMLDLIKGLLDTASLESEHLKLNMEKNNLGDILKTIVESNIIIAEKKDQKISFINKLNVFIYCDSIKIIQLFDNLISNAIKYSPQGNDIDIKIEVKKNKAIIQVKDFGPGINDNDKKNLFVKFQRLSAKPTAGESSTGLGLSICKSIVERHSGEIYVESEIGKGSIFIVKLPLFKELNTT